MLSRRCRWISSSGRSPVCSRPRPISSTSWLADSQKDHVGSSAEAAQRVADSKLNLSRRDHDSTLRPSSASQVSDSRHFGYPPPHRPSSTSIRPPSGPTSPPFLEPSRPGYPPFRSEQRQPTPPAQAANFQAPYRGQPSFAPRNSYGHPHPKPSGYYPPPGASPPRDFRTPPFNQHLSPNAAPQFSPQHPPPLPFQPRQGLHGLHPAEAKRLYPQFHSPHPAGPAAPSSPPYISHPSSAPAQSAPSPQRWMMFPQAPFAAEVSPTSPVAQNPSSQISISRSRKLSQSGNSLDFDLQDLAGGDALDRDPFAQNHNTPAHPTRNPSRAFPNHPVDGRSEAAYDGRHLARPQTPERWRSNVFVGPTAYSNPPPRQNLNPRNSNWKGSSPAGHDRHRPTGNTRRPLGPSRTPRARGRGLLASTSGPSLPPPPKTVLNDRGEFGTEPSPSGAPQSTTQTLSTKPEKKSIDEELPTDYRAISKLIASSNIDVKLPGLHQSVQFEPSKLLQSVQSSEITWAHGEAKRDQVVKRAFDLVVKNPSLKIDQKRGTVALVDFLLMSREERMSKIKSSD